MTAFTDAFDDLEQHLIGDEADLDTPAVGDLDAVERLLRGMAWRRRKIAQARELVDAMKARLDDWFAAQERRYDCSHHEQVLVAYHQARLADDPKAKTISFPSGTLSSRAGQPRWVIDDEAFLPWATTYATDLVRVRHEPDRDAIKRTLQVDERGVAVDGAGEIVPGVLVEPAEVSFKVKVGDE